VRVVAPDGEQIGVKSLQEALWLSDQLGLDLVEVAPNAKPPVARLMDYGKFKYEQSVKEREARKKQAKSTVKELTFKVKIGDHDYQIKRDRAARFLSEGDKVRVRIWFRGREASRPELGRKIMDRLASDLEPFGKVEQDAKQEGRNMTMVFGPVKQAPQEQPRDAEPAATASEPSEESPEEE
jgi:translation initiation factor IF-3